MQPHVEAATVYGLRRQALLVFLPKYHLKVCPQNLGVVDSIFRFFVRTTAGGPA